MTREQAEKEIEKVFEPAFANYIIEALTKGATVSDRKLTEMTREEQLDWLCRLRSEIYVYMPKEWLIPMNDALDMSIKALEQEPRKGKWIDNTDLGYHVSICSNCSWRGHGDTNLIYKPKFCPNCGADMRGE